MYWRAHANACIFGTGARSLPLVLPLDAGGPWNDGRIVSKHIFTHQHTHVKTRAARNETTKRKTQSTAGAHNARAHKKYKHAGSPTTSALRVRALIGDVRIRCV